MDDSLAIWWLSESECGFVREYLAAELPVYIIAELVSMSGRPKRARLWVPPEINFHSVIGDPRVLHSEYLDKRGGIVVHAKDADKLKFLPGYVTDTKMNTFCEPVAALIES